MKKEGAAIRYSALYKAEGCNINFVKQQSPNTFTARTYERGVENETLSCGTGVTAVALAMHHAGQTTASQIIVQTLGGTLQVQFTPTETGYEQIYLIGQAIMVYKGEWTC